MKKRMVFLIPVIVFIGVLMLFKTVFFIGFVPSASMEPTLKTNSVIFGTRIYGTLSALLVSEGKSLKWKVSVTLCRKIAIL